jgi:DUF1365 family protein
MYDNSICTGTVWHKRYKTKEHEFFYQLNTWLIRITSQQYSWQNFFYKFRNKDYLRDSYEKYPNLQQRIYNKLNEFNIKQTDIDDVFLLGQISNLGIYFSPLNLYFCYKNNQCRYILCEVSNTPWNERHYYILDNNQELETEKNFHVSPFFDIKQKYKWSFNLQHNNISFSIDSYENEIVVFSASYNATINNIDSKKLINKNKFNVFKIYFGIYYEALKLFIKKVPFISHPNSKK